MDSAMHDTEYGDGGVGLSTNLVLYVALIRLSELLFAHSSRLGGWYDHWLWIWYVVFKA